MATWLADKLFAAALAVYGAARRLGGPDWAARALGDRVADPRRAKNGRFESADGNVIVLPVETVPGQLTLQVTQYGVAPVRAQLTPHDADRLAVALVEWATEETQARIVYPFLRKH